MDLEQYFDEILCPFIAANGEKCKTPLQRHQKFCHECGDRVDSSWFVKQATSPLMDVCTGIDEDGNICGGQLDASVKFCSNCGTRSM